MKVVVAGCDVECIVCCVFVVCDRIGAGCVVIYIIVTACVVAHVVDVVVIYCNCYFSYAVVCHAVSCYLYCYCWCCRTCTNLFAVVVVVDVFVYSASQYAIVLSHVCVGDYGVVVYRCTIPNRVDVNVVIYCR